MSKKVFFPIFLLMSIIGIGYATSFVLENRNERLMGCFHNGMYYQPGQTWVGEQDGKRYRFYCEEGGTVKIIEELAPLEKYPLSDF